MRRLSVALVALTAAIALMALVSPSWAKPTRESKPLVVSPTEVRPGQLVKVSGGGCRGITVLVLLIDSKQFHRGRPNRSGDFAYQLKLPTGLRSGDHDMSGHCGRHHVGKARFKVSHRSRTSFDVSPDTVVRGDRRTSTASIRTSLASDSAECGCSWARRNGSVRRREDRGREGLALRH